MPTRIQLEAAASEVISVLKGIREFSNARIAVIGGLALWKYLPNGRTTEVSHLKYVCTFLQANLVLGR